MLRLAATARVRDFLISRAGWLLLSPLGGTAGHSASCDGEDAGESTFLQQSLKVIVFDQTADSHRFAIFWARSWDFIPSAKTNSVVGKICNNPPKE